MIRIGTQRLGQLLDAPSLIRALEQAFARETTVPARHSFTIDASIESPGTMLLMPAWQSGRYVAVKLVTVFAGNATRSLPTVQGAVLLFDASTGTPLASMDGAELTLRRTAAASALAAKYLARADATRLLMVGTGQLAPHVITAHASIRPIREVRIWGRDQTKARQLAQRFARASFDAQPVESLQEAMASADIISCATLANEPLVHGEDLAPGQHLDLIGAFTPAMREADTEAVRRAAVYVDTYDGALVESGEIVQALRANAITRDHIRGEMAELVRGTVPGRTGTEQITLFKSVGTAIEDLAAAELAYARSIAAR
jgi:ornithine cyclodeaminase